MYKRTPLGISGFPTICFKGLQVSTGPQWDSWSLPHLPVCCGGGKELPKQFAFWLSERHFFPLFWQLPFLTLQGRYWDTHHPLRNCGQYYLFPPGNNCGDGSSVKLMQVNVTIPWASWLAGLPWRKRRGSLGKQKSPCVVSLHLHIFKILISSCLRLCENTSQHIFIQSQLVHWKMSRHLSKSGISTPGGRNKPIMQHISL